MAKITMQRVGKLLVGSNEAAEAEIERHPRGADLIVDISRPRNLRFHRLYWALCTYVAEALNSGPGQTEWTQERVSVSFKIATGYATKVELPERVREHYGADVALVPASISFANMDQGEFAIFVEQAIRFTVETFGSWIEEHPNWRHVREIVDHAIGAEARENL